MSLKTIFFSLKNKYFKTERNKNIIHGSISGLMSKGFSGFIGLITIPLVLNVLGKNEYAIWMVLLSLVSWLQLSDFGLLNGIVNVLSEAFARKDFKKIRTLIYTGFICGIWIALFGTILCLLISNIINYEKVFNIHDAALIDTTRKSFIIISIAFFVNIPLSIIPKIVYAFQVNHLVNYAQIVSSFLNLIVVIILSRFAVELHWWILVSMLIPIVVNLFLYMLLLKKFTFIIHDKGEKPLFDKKILKEILNISISLFIFQIGALIVNNTANFVILHKGTLSMVTDFNIVWKVQWFIYSTGAALTYSLYPAIREAFVNKEYSWIVKAVKKGILIQGGYAILCCLPFLIFNGDKLIQLWTKKSLSYSIGFWGWMEICLFLIISSIGSIFSDSLKLLDQIKVQIGIVFLNGLFLNISLFYFIPLLQTNGIILSFILGTFIGTLLVGLAYRNFLRNKIINYA